MLVNDGEMSISYTHLTIIEKLHQLQYDFSIACFLPLGLRASSTVDSFAYTIRKLTLLCKPIIYFLLFNFLNQNNSLIF